MEQLNLVAECTKPNLLPDFLADYEVPAFADTWSQVSLLRRAQNKLGLNKELSFLDFSKLIEKHTKK